MSSKARLREVRSAPVDDKWEAVIYKAMSPLLWLMSTG